MVVERTRGAGVAERVREARRARGWSQSELATKAGVSRPTVARIEGGQHVLMGTLEKVTEALGLAMDLGPAEFELQPDRSSRN